MKPFDEIDRALEGFISAIKDAEWERLRASGTFVNPDEAWTLYRDGARRAIEQARAARALLAVAVKGGEVWFVRGEENEPPNGHVYRLVKEMPRRHDDEVRYRVLVLPYPETREVERGEK